MGARLYGIDQHFWLSGNVAFLDRLASKPPPTHIRVRRAVNQAEVLRGFAGDALRGQVAVKERRVAVQIEAMPATPMDMLRRGIDIRYVVTSLRGSDAEHITKTIYCVRGQAENLIKQHKRTTEGLIAPKLPIAAGQPTATDPAHRVPGCYSTCVPQSRAGSAVRHAEFATIRLPSENRRTLYQSTRAVFASRSP